MRVYKFGGTSVGSADRMKKVAEIIQQTDEKKIVVLSAVSGTTNKLVALANALYMNDKEEVLRKIDAFTANFKVSYEEWTVKKYDPFFNINNREDLNIAKKLIIIKD